MKQVWSNAAAAVLGLLLLGSGAVFWSLGAGLNICQVDEEISLTDREAAAEVSTSFIGLVRAGETTAALARMSSVARASTDRATLLNITEHSLATPASEPQVRKTYSLWSLARPRGYASCRSEEGTAFVARGGGPHTLFTIVAEAVQGGERAWTFWLEREDREWRVRSVHFGLSDLAGRNGAELWALAEEQRRKNNVFNSTALYDLANLTLYRGDFLQPAEANGFAQARRRWRRHQDLIQSRLHLGDEAFPIAGVRAIATAEGDFILMLDQALELPITVSEANQRNRALIEGMNAHRSEWREIFDGLSVGSPTGPNRVWRTLYHRERGYSPDPR